MRLRVAPGAEEELAEAAAWYEARRPGLGIELVAVIDRELEEIAAAPSLHALWRTDRPYRHRAVRRFPYVIFFRAEVGEVFIVAIAHARRRPGYWAGR
ncbi:MAG TPA: type II toxin-antitoxin system RelE/ParE family toxin [Polyangiaceae bacterium]